jgi:hypothetical protein
MNYKDKIFDKFEAEGVPATVVVTGSSSNKKVDENISLEAGGVIRGALKL